MSSLSYSFLALGDSYTIGEGLPIADSFPFQTVQLLRAEGISFSDPLIVAKTGWTTDELMEGIAAAPVRSPYDFVSLLIGVNNEYRGLSTAEYAEEFGLLLLQAIRFAGGKSTNTFVLSIPDWSVTPFAEANLPDKLGRDRAMVAAEIDAFNAIARQIADRYQVDFSDITEHTRAVGLLTPETTETSSICTPASKVSSSPEGGGGPLLHGNGPWLAADGLHPSGREYRWWAELLTGRIRERIATGWI